ncbi:MAG: dipeptide epimerase [Oceanicaulis sp.]|uniref:N-acetyl-D-Glu racemase DgcA n=1 Tax=unclassified Oceanicaulis TaxID=2632123 RepID=UPI0003256B75|nr:MULTISPECIES: N-acetyl-D-Glu racemase DgcA [unclassified Oceanicaulis]MBC38071.1 dipeptide epimerase [Oceanicaulis sp.]MBG34977.1 dipeptide epimerase [Oceanicaulis sp.]HBU61138.1 dipeptide epimerase [Oceanicaulis sp.]
MRLSVHRTSWPMTAPFVITGHVFDSLEAVVVTLEREGVCGSGEGVPVYYLQESAVEMLDQIEAVRAEIEAGITREGLLDLMPAGGARNAVDCALWDLEAKSTGQSVWDMADIRPQPCRTAYTLGIQKQPDLMAAQATRARDFKLIKIKLDGVDPVERVMAVRKARPDVQIIIDANQGFTFDMLQSVLEPFAALGVAMVEQPLPRGDDAALEGFKSPIPLCADESCLHRGELAQALGRYDMINIKLDKTGGLTEALLLAREARAAGKGLMVGNMLGTSLSMAPAFVIAQLCDFVDLDGPLNLKSDTAPAMRYHEGLVEAPTRNFWGCA